MKIKYVYSEEEAARIIKNHLIANGTIKESESEVSIEICLSLAPLPAPLPVPLPYSTNDPLVFKTVVDPCKTHYPWQNPTYC